MSYYKTVFSHELVRRALLENHEAITKTMENMAREIFDVKNVVFNVKEDWRGRLYVEAVIYRPEEIK